MVENRIVYSLILIFVLCISCKGQIKSDTVKETITPETKELITAVAPGNISRSIEQDRNGDIWIAAFDGVFRFDGKSFINITKEVSTDRFFSVLEDRKGNMWFGSIGSGVYCYDGKTFQNYTNNEGLINNEIVSIYEDKIGDIWFGGNGGVSQYDGKSFRNYKMEGDSIIEDMFGSFILNSQRPVHEVNSIIEDKTGKLWLATRGGTFIYDGKSFTSVSQNGKTFSNVRWLIEDQKGNIWLGGQDGLWRYDGSTYTNFTKNFVGYIYEDKNGDIWTSSQNAVGMWELSRYDVKSLSVKKPTITELKPELIDNKGMIFGILEAKDGSIWYGALDGVYRYDGKTITGFKGNEEQK